MQAFATVEDYSKRYGDVDDEEMVEVMLEDASRYIASQLDKIGRSDDYLYPTDDYAERLAQVCVQMAHRAIGETDTIVPYGASQFSQGAGGYTEQFTMANPYGSFFLEKTERTLLGLDDARIGFAVPGVYQ